MDDTIKENSSKNGLEALKNIGVAEISKTTHIEREYIQYMLDKNFEKLLSYNVKGFVRIIEREYDVNLQAWYDEFVMFKSGVKVEEKSIIMHTVAKNISTTSSYERRGSGWLLWLLLLVFGVAAVFYFKLYQYFDMIPNLFEDKNRSTTYSNVSVVDNVEEKLETAGVEVPKFDDDKNLILNSDINITEHDENQTATVTMNALDKSIEKENGALKDDNVTQVETIIEPVNSKGAYILPRFETWIGIISLSDNKKTTITTAKPFELDLSKEQLILTGHGTFDVEIEGKKESYKDKNPIRLLIKNGKVSKISYDEFLKANHGKAW